MSAPARDLAHVGLVVTERDADLAGRALIEHFAMPAEVAPVEDEVIRVLAREHGVRLRARGLPWRQPVFRPLNAEQLN